MKRYLLELADALLFAFFIAIPFVIYFWRM